MANQIDAADVSVVEKEPACCDDCGNAATHYVMLDMRSTGAKTAVAELCKEHAELFAEMLRMSLPPESNEP